MNKNKALKISIEIAIAIIVIISFVLINEQIKQNRSDSFFFIEDGNKYAYQVEKLEVDGNDVVISGWFFELKSVRNISKDIEDNKQLGMLLYDINAPKPDKDMDGFDKASHGIPLSVEYTVREDVNSYFGCNYDYSKCGFIARTNKANLDLNQGEYQVIFKPDEKETYGVGSMTYIDKGELKYVNPKETPLLDTTGTDLERIVNEGWCLVSNPEHHFYVFQFEKKLYWITENGFCFEDDGDTFIQYTMETTQFDKLPKEYIDKGWFWGNLSASFEKYEITQNMNCGDYRVSVREIPENFSVTLVNTAYSSNGTVIWSNIFRPLFLYN